MRRAPLTNAEYVRGFTLIEMLAVVAILSMVMATAMVRLSVVSGSAAVQAAMATLRQLDARSRLLAQTDGRAVIIIPDQDGSVLRAVSRDGSRDQAMAATMPAGLHAQLVREDQAIESVAVDRLGRSIDYGIELRDRASNQVAARLLVCGLTGWVLEDRP